MTIRDDKYDLFVAQERLESARRMIWIVYIGLAGHAGLVLFWAGLQGGWWL